jgi:hypothetical protein
MTRTHTSTTGDACVRAVPLRVRAPRQPTGGDDVQGS